jgi:hypothetical protein
VKILISKTGKTSFAEVVDYCAAGKVSQDELKDWFEKHKIRL